MTTDSSIKPVSSKSRTDAKNANGRKDEPYDVMAGYRRVGYQGNNKKTGDVVFEAKRTEYEKKTSKINEEIEKLQVRMNKANAKIRDATTNDVTKGIKSELRTKINELRAKKDQTEEQRALLLRRLKETQDGLKRKVDEMNVAKEKFSYKKIEEIDSKLREMDKTLESGTIKLIEEKRVVAEMSKMRKNRKALEALSGQQAEIDASNKQVDQLKTAIAEKDAEMRIDRDQIRELTTRINAISNDRDTYRSHIQSLIAEKDEIRKLLEAQYTTKRTDYEELQKAVAVHRVWLKQDYIKRQIAHQRRDIEHAIRQCENDMKNLDLFPCADQISQCINLVNYLRSNYLKESGAATSSIVMNGKVLASSPAVAALLMPLEIRKVEPVDRELVLKNKLSRSEGETYYFKAVPKKSAKGKSKQATSSVQHLGALNPFSNVKLPFWVMAGLEELGVGLPSTVSEVQEVVIKLDKAKEALQAEQQEKMKHLDSRRAEIQARIDEQKAKLLTVSTKVAAEIKLRDVERERSTKTNATELITV